MKKVLIVLFLGVLFSVFSAINVHAEMGCCMGGMEDDMPMMQGMKHHGKGMKGDGHHMWGLLMGLGLDEQQKEAIKEIKTRVMKDSVRKKADIDVAKIELKDILHKDQVDLNAAEAKLKQIASLKTDLQFSHIKAMEEVKAKLTPEQRKKFKESLMKEKGREHGMGKKHKGGKKEEMKRGPEHMQ